MKKRILPIVFLAGSLPMSLIQAAEVEVTWEKPKEFSDIKPANESQKSFRNRTLKQFEAYFAKLAEALPAGQKLRFTVTNVDLAGEVWPASFVGLGHGGSDVRLIKSIYIPRMTFSYTLTDAKNNELQSAEVKLKDMSFQDRSVGRFRDDSLRYEKNMLKRWFKDEFPDLVAKN